MLPFRSIICPTDFDEPSQAALKAATEFAQHFGAKLYLVHIIPEPPILSYYPDPGLGLVPSTVSMTSPSQIQDSLRTGAQEHLESIALRKIPTSVEVECVVSFGDPAHEILRLIEQEGAELLVVGTHGRTGWRRLFYGSIAEKEVRLAPCPVIVIHNTPEGGAAEKIVAGEVVADDVTNDVNADDSDAGSAIPQLVVTRAAISSVAF